jgi:hypothetical protein
LKVTNLPLFLPAMGSLGGSDEDGAKALVSATELVLGLHKVSNIAQ